MKEGIKVLHVFGELGIGGAEIMIMNIFRVIDPFVVQFDFVEHTEDKCFFEQEIEEEGSVIYHCPKYNGKNHFQYRSWWKNFFQEHQEYDILHSHVRSSASIYMEFAKECGIKTIIHSHSTSNGGGLSSIIKAVTQYPLRYQADFFLACSMDAGKWLFGKRICKSNRFQIIKNAIDVKKFLYNQQVRNEIRRELGINDKFVVGFLARVSVPKNPLFVLDIFEELLKLRSGVKLLFIGDGELLPYIKEKTVEKKIDTNVIFMGLRSDVERMYQAMDCYLLPSLWEGLGISLIEAQASGLKCICSENIPKEAILSENVKIMKLNVGCKIWAENISKIDMDYDRKDMYDVIADAGYDIFEASKSLISLYQSIVLDEEIDL